MSIISEHNMLFDVGLLEVMDAVSVPSADKLDLTINPRHLKSYKGLVKQIRACIGQPLNLITRPYRIAGERYMVIVITGLKTHLNLTLSIAGYLRWPSQQSVGRLYMEITDSVDGYYLSEYLKRDLLPKTGPKIAS